MTSKPKYWLYGILISVIIGVVLISGCVQQQKPVKDQLLKENKSEDSHFGFMHPEHFEEMEELNVYWQRPHAGPFIWDEIEPEPGQFDWVYADEVVKESQNHDINILATLWPFAEWDQSSCHQKLPAEKTEDFGKLGEYRQKPCNMQAYKNFVKKVVERYDGDGFEDMPELKYPIKYWEVSNEPSMQEDLVFFKGTPEDYFEILKTTYQAVKEADPDAKVVQGGMAGLGDEERVFWQAVLDLGGGKYFDIANIHYVGVTPEAFDVPELKEFLEKNGLNKPFWITELQYSAMALGEDRLSEDEWAKFMIKNFVQAFNTGADKIFYIGLEESPSDPEAWLIKDSEKQETYQAFKTMVSKIDYFSSVKKLGERQYKFIVNDKPVYVLWGTGNLPTEITGTVKVTDIHGSEMLLDVSQITLNDSPIFIEVEK
ncbi:MAG TPA: hypothetical protein ENI41_03070 [Deltaproteobacteria bacterium]|nr:hypothetical protein [Deltaproteobacteria bacterium]